MTIMRTVTLLSIAATLLVSCAQDEPVSTSASAQPAIALSPDGPDAWRATYTLSSPAPSLRFARNPDDSRNSRWRVEDGYEIVHVDGADYLKRADGAEFTSAYIIAPARYAVLPKDYAPFSPYTDGGLLIFSGQFQACAGPDECPDDATWPLTVTPPKDAHIIVEGAAHERSVTFTESGDGTNIYVGEGEPIASSHFIAVVDASLPAEVNDALHSLLPPLMDYFTERLGPLSERPMLFASLDPNAPKESGYSSQGGTLPNQIFIHLYGEQWALNASEKLAGFLPWFFAHEVGHLFQHARSNYAEYEMDQSWIHEGGADAFAALTIARFGGAEESYVTERILRAERDCADGLKALDGKPLNASSETGAFDNYYSCGLLMHLAIDAEVKKTSGGERDLLDVWNTFLSRVSAGAAWDQDVFLAIAREAGAPKAADFASALASETQEDPAGFIRAAMIEAGLPVTD
ncbi:MAG: hypothetical protein H6848_02115 [Caulobacterales bacterium]|nr:hypothetical protein [Caulobacterales bacterium]